MTLQTFAATDDTHDMVVALQQSGAVVINAVLPEAVSEELCADLRPEFDREGHLYQNEFNGHQTLRVGGVTKYSAHFPTLLLHPIVLAIADTILKPHCEVYQVGSTTAIEILPGEDAQVLHADDACYPSHLLPFEAQISALWALDDFTVENGATRVVPREMGVEKPEDAREEHVVQAVMPRGSVDEIYRIYQIIESIILILFLEFQIMFFRNTPDVLLLHIEILVKPWKP